MHYKPTPEAAARAAPGVEAGATPGLEAGATAGLIARVVLGVALGVGNQGLLEDLHLGGG